MVSKISRIEFIGRSADPTRKADEPKVLLTVDGKQISRIRRVTVEASWWQAVPTVTVELLAHHALFDVHGRFQPLLELREFEEEAVRHLYEQLKRRFEPEDCIETTEHDDTERRSFCPDCEDEILEPFEQAEDE